MLSPETVRTHVRNAMAKLGASTRSQAVALALQQREITADPEGARASRSPAAARPELAEPTRSTALTAMLAGLVSLYDVDGGAVYLADEDGLALRPRRRRRARAPAASSCPAEVALGEGAARPRGARAPRPAAAARRAARAPAAAR